MPGLQYERIALDFIKEFYPDAEARGGYNAAESDIYIPSRDAYIEVKYKTAQCGQFVVENMGHRLHSSIPDNQQLVELLNRHYHTIDFSGNVNFRFKYEGIRDWIYQFYSNKGVFKVCIVHDKHCELMSLKKFVETTNFIGTLRAKKSGSRNLPLSDYASVSVYLNRPIRIEGSKAYNENGESNFYFSIDGEKYFVNKKYEVRKLSQTKSLTVIFSFER